MTQSHFLLGLTLAIMALLVAVAGPVFTRHRRRLFRLMLFSSGVLLVAALAVLLISTPSGTSHPKVRVSDARVRAIIHKRCSVCHAEHPSEPGYTSPPDGLVLETPQQVLDHAHRVYRASVASHFMPLGNITNMTSAERTSLGHWIDQH